MSDFIRIRYFGDIHVFWSPNEYVDRNGLTKELKRKYCLRNGYLFHFPRFKVGDVKQQVPFSLLEKLNRGVGVNFSLIGLARIDQLFKVFTSSAFKDMRKYR